MSLQAWLLTITGTVECVIALLILGGIRGWQRDPYTQHVDHELGRTADGRMDSAWFGRGEIIKGAAVAALVD